MRSDMAACGLSHQPDAGTQSWLNQRDAGRLSDQGPWDKLTYLARLNLAHNYINAIRKASNDPAWLERAAHVERRLFDGFGANHAAHHAPTPRMLAYQASDLHIERGAVPLALTGAMREELMHQREYHDRYVPGWTYHGKGRTAPYPMLYMPPDALFASDAFLAICASPAIMGFAQEVLGPAAAVSWGWAWISNPGFADYQNQNWHRDSSEPLNFVHVFVPLDTIASMEDGPTVVIAGTSHHRGHCEVRRYEEAEVADLREQHGATPIMADEGDAYFVNTFCLHRATAPQRQRRMLAMIISIAPHRSPTIKRRAFASLPESLGCGGGQPAFLSPVGGVISPDCWRAPGPQLARV
jgi:hypothetical protein